MTQTNSLYTTPPYAIEQALKRFGNNLRQARLKRNLTLQQIADKVGSGVRVIADAEKGKITTGVGAYAAILWALDLIEQLEEVADPSSDKVGQVLVSARQRARSSSEWDLNNDF